MNTDPIPSYGKLSKARNYVDKTGVIGFINEKMETENWRWCLSAAHAGLARRVRRMPKRSKKSTLSVMFPDGDKYFNPWSFARLSKSTLNERRISYEYH